MPCEWCKDKPAPQIAAERIKVSGCRVTQALIGDWFALQKQDGLGAGMRTWLTCRVVQGKCFTDDLWRMCVFFLFLGGGLFCSGGGEGGCVMLWNLISHPECLRCCVLPVSLKGAELTSRLRQLRFGCANTLKCSFVCTKWNVCKKPRHNSVFTLQWSAVTRHH